MDKECDKLLCDILNETSKILDDMQGNKATFRNADPYIDRLGRLTNIVMSVRTGFVLSNQPVFATVPDFKEEII